MIVEVEMEKKHDTWDIKFPKVNGGLVFKGVRISGWDDLYVFLREYFPFMHFFMRKVFVDKKKGIKKITLSLFNAGEQFGIEIAIEKAKQESQAAAAR